MVSGAAVQNCPASITNPLGCSPAPIPRHGLAKEIYYKMWGWPSMPILPGTAAAQGWECAQGCREGASAQPCRSACGECSHVPVSGAVHALLAEQPQCHSSWCAVAPSQAANPVLTARSGVRRLQNPPQLTDPSRTASMKNSDTMQTWTIPVEQQPSPVSMSFFQSRALWVKAQYFLSFQEICPTKAMCMGGFMVFLGLLGWQRAAVMHSNPMPWFATTLGFASPEHKLLAQNIVGLHSPFVEALTAGL